MAVAMVMQWQGVTQEQYDRVMNILGLDEDPPEGAILHIAGPTNDGWRVVDIWDAQESFQTFLQERLMAATQEAGMSGQPNVQFFPLYNVWAPGGNDIARLGASSLPAAATQTA